MLSQYFPAVPCFVNVCVCDDLFKELRAPNLSIVNSFGLVLILHLFSYSFCLLIFLIVALWAMLMDLPGYPLIYVTSSAHSRLCWWLFLGVVNRTCKQ